MGSDARLDSRLGCSVLPPSDAKRVEAWVKAESLEWRVGLWRFEGCKIVVRVDTPLVKIDLQKLEGRIRCQHVHRLNTKHDRQ
jgi:hypothetical protein